MKKLSIFTITLALAALGLQAFKVHSNKPVKPSAKIKTWKSLFDGKTLAGWHNYNRKGEVKNWIVEDGLLVCPGGTEGGDIVTDKQYANFELSWDWKVEKGANSGVLYHVVEDAKYPYTSETGPEYQIIDDLGWPDKLEDWQKTGCDYAMHLPNNSKKLMPAGEWNTSKIIFNNRHVEHWLNGKKILSFTAWDADWNEKKAEGKWKDHPGYGVAKTGVIALQEHGKKTFYKNIFIKEL